MSSIRSIGTTPRYWEDRVYWPVALLGLMAVMLSLAVGAIAGLYIGDIFAPGGDAAADQVRRGVAESTGAWNTAVLFFGASMLMTAVLVVLRRIIKTIRYRGEAMQAHLPTLFTTLGGK